MLRRRLFNVPVFLFLGSLPVFVMVHAGPQKRTLVVTGHPGELPLVEIGGRSYVDIEALARLADGSLSFKGNQIVLTLPAPVPSAPASNLETRQSGTAGFSKDFLKAAIEEMAGIREWRSTLINAVRQGNSVTEDWVGAFRGQAQKDLRLASLAASTESDRDALQLLISDFNNMNKLSDRFVEANKSRTYVSPNALDNDPLDQKILNCAHSLASMASNNQFLDDGSCH
jgi:hypothetical protein